MCDMRTGLPIQEVHQHPLREDADGGCGWSLEGAWPSLDLRSGRSGLVGVKSGLVGGRWNLQVWVVLLTSAAPLDGPISSTG